MKLCLFFILLSVFSKDVSFRRDFFLDQKKYAEEGPIPTHGGRGTVIIIIPKNVTSFKISSIKLNNVESSHLWDSDDFTYIDWLKYSISKENFQMWITFHSRNEEFMFSQDMSIKIVNDKDEVFFDDKVNFNSAKKVENFKISYVVMENDNSPNVLVHFHNYNISSNWEISKLTFNGIAIPFKPLVLSSNDHFVYKFPKPGSPFVNGEVYTIVIENSNGKTIGNGGKLWKRKTFPIEHWPHSSDCALPEVKHENYLIFANAGVNSVYYSLKEIEKDCGVADYVEYVNEVLPKYPDFTLFIDKNIDSLKGITNFNAISQQLLSDEPEFDKQWEMRARELLKSSMELQEKYPFVPSYIGGASNLKGGYFSGITDIKGIDFYVAACAPCIIPVVHASIPLEGSLDYLRSVRNNVMPNIPLFYSQFYSHAWSYQANENEIMVQLMSAIMAGSKGLMLFQGAIEYFKSDFNNTLASLLRSIGHIKPIIVTGDIDGMIVDGKTIENNEPYEVQVVRNDKEILLLFFSRNADGYNQMLCHVGAKKHWNFKDYNVKKVKFKSEQVRKIENVTEIENGKEVNLKLNAKISFDGSKIVAENIVMKENFPFRIFKLSYS